MPGHPQPAQRRGRSGRVRARLRRPSSKISAPRSLGSKACVAAKTLIGAPRGISVYDDFAHHPTAVRETLKALRQKHPSGKLYAVFEPPLCHCVPQPAPARVHRMLGRRRRGTVRPARPRQPRRRRTPRSRRRRHRAKRARPQTPDKCPPSTPSWPSSPRAPNPATPSPLLSNGAFGGIYPKLLNQLA